MDNKGNEKVFNSWLYGIAKLNQQWLMRFSNNDNDFDGEGQDHIGNNWLVQGKGSAALHHDS